MTQKNVYSVFDAESGGRIVMSNKVFDDPDGRYGKILHEREMKFVNHAGTSHAHLGRHFVNNGAIQDMPRMPIRLSRTRIGIGDANGATIANIPPDATLTILANGLQFFPSAGESGVVSGRRVDISAPVPGVYTLIIAKFPYREWRREVIAQ